MSFLSPVEVRASPVWLALADKESCNLMVVEITQSHLFDYAGLDEPTRAFVQDKAQRIHARLKRTAEDIIAIGQDLIEVKSRLGHGNYECWLKSEFEMSLWTANKFVQVAVRFKSVKFTDLPVSVLYELAAPSTPETVIQMIETGQVVPTLSAIREAKREMQTEHVPVRQFVDDVFPCFTQWQADNIALGLDRFGDVPVNEESEQEPEPIQEEKTPHNVHTLRVMGSSESPEWYTPQEIIDLVLGCLGEIDLDPCSNSHEQPSVRAGTLYTRDDNGLAYPWQGKVYLNPPYGSEIPGWIEKLVAEYETGNIEEAIALLPARIDTQWFQPLYAYPMCHVRGRLQFANAQNSAPFPSILVYLGRRSEKFIETFKDLGPIMRRIG